MRSLTRSMGAAAVFDTAAATPPTVFAVSGEKEYTFHQKCHCLSKHILESDAKIVLSWLYVLIKSTKNAYKNTSLAHDFPQSRTPAPKPCSMKAISMLSQDSSVRVIQTSYNSLKITIERITSSRPELSSRCC
jgi:hypothetical protein